MLSQCAHQYRYDKPCKSICNQTAGNGKKTANWLKKKKSECTQRKNGKLIMVDSGKKKEEKKNWIDFSATGVSDIIFMDAPVKGRHKREGKNVA